MPRFTAVRREYMSGTSTPSASNGQACYSGTCAVLGVETQRFQSLTLGPGSGGAVIIDGIAANSFVYVFAVCGRGVAGNIRMRISGSAIGDFSDAVIVFDGVFEYPANDCAHLCFVLDDVGPSGDCIYGTELRPSAQPVVIVTSAIISLITDNLAAPFLDVVLGALVGQSVNLQALCGTLPPQVPVIDLSTLNASIQTMHGIFNYVAWFSYCQCKPGVPPPTTPTPTSLVAPQGWPTLPPLPASPTDQPGTNTAVMQALQQLLSREADLLELVTLIQRWQLPFAVVPTIRHEDLVGMVTIGVSRVVGLRIEVSSNSTTSSELFGNPPYITDVGWISVSDGGAMLQEIRITRVVQEWFPPQMQLATFVGVALRPGATANIIELVVEP